MYVVYIATIMLLEIGYYIEHLADQPSLLLTLQASFKFSSPMHKIYSIRLENPFKSNRIILFFLYLTFLMYTKINVQ